MAPLERRHSPPPALRPLPTPKMLRPSAEPSSMTRRIVVGISGASGALYAQRLLRLLLAAGVEPHLVVSPLGQRLLHDELGMEGIDLPALAGRAAGEGSAA